MRLSFRILSALVAFSTVVLSDAGNHQANAAEQKTITSGQSTHPDAVPRQILVAQAQTRLSAAQTPAPEDPIRGGISNRVNANTVTVISGSVGGSFIRVAADLATVLDDGDEMRVLGVLGKGALQNMKDIVYLKGVDIGIVRSDTLAYLDKRGDISNLRKRHLPHPTVLRRGASRHPQGHHEYRAIARPKGQFRSGRQRGERARHDRLRSLEHPGRRAQGRRRYGDREAEEPARLPPRSTW